MITDPTSLVAIALLVGILGLAVLVLPLLILFWSQMQPQLIGLVSVDRSSAPAGDDYATQESLPKLMKSFGSIAELEKKAAKKAKSKPAAKKKPTKSAARTKASSATKTVKAKAAKTKAKPKAKTKAATKSTTSKPKAKMAAAKKASPSTKSTTRKPAAKKAKAKSVARRTPTGAKRDAVLGVVYSKKPKETDDLTQIKGVAKVIEGKLHKAGIYTYRQIVEWDATAIDAFSDKLSFKGRIRNEGWQKQCAKFHKAKYDEKIG